MLLVRQILTKDPGFRGSIAAIEKLESQIDMAAIEWAATMREALRLKETNGSDILYVRYEDLLCETKDTLASILQFCGLRADDTTQAYAQMTLRDSTVHAVPVLHPDVAPYFHETMRLLGYGERV